MQKIAFHVKKSKMFRGRYTPQTSLDSPRTFQRSQTTHLPAPLVCNISHGSDSDISNDRSIGSPDVNSELRARLQGCDTIFARKRSIFERRQRKPPALQTSQSIIVSLCFCYPKNNAACKTTASISLVLFFFFSSGASATTSDGDGDVRIRDLRINIYIYIGKLYIIYIHIPHYISERKYN